MTVSLDTPHSTDLASTPPEPPTPDATAHAEGNEGPDRDTAAAASDEPTTAEADDSDNGEDHGGNAPVAATPEQVAAQIEAVLFVSDGPVPERTLRDLLGVTRRPLNQALDALDAQLTGGGLLLQRGPDGVQLVTAPIATTTVETFLGLEAGRKLSRAALETVAIVAYRQPVTRAQIDAIRGVNSDGALATLRSRELVTDVGRADTPGRPVLFGTTQRFLEHFGLARPDDLPPLPQDVELPSPERQLPLDATGIAESDADEAQPTAAVASDPQAEHAGATADGTGNGETGEGTADADSTGGDAPSAGAPVAQATSGASRPRSRPIVAPAVGPITAVGGVISGQVGDTNITATITATGVGTQGDASALRFPRLPGS